MEIYHGKNIELEKSLGTNPNFERHCNIFMKRWDAKTKLIPENNHISSARRIIPVSKWLVTMVNKSPKDRVVGPLPNGRFMAHKIGMILTTYKAWDPILQDLQWLQTHKVGGKATASYKI